MSAYYNEHDPKAAAWLRELIKDGHIADGTVDERSICDVEPTDLLGFTQCHFFAGIGGWSLALRLAGWPDERPVWTGSCPCQPFSAAGKQKGTADERHLWPVFFRLIRECAPAIVFGEQVASAIALGWLDGVCADLEGAGYAVGAADLCAAGVGAPHIRQRLWWVAVAGQQSTGRLLRGPGESDAAAGKRASGESGGSGDAVGVGDAAADGCKVRPSLHGEMHGEGSRERCEPCRLEHAPLDGREQRRAESGGRILAGGCGTGRLADALSGRGEAGISKPEQRQKGHAEIAHDDRSGIAGGMGDAAQQRDGAESFTGGDCEEPGKGRERGAGGSGASFWSDSILIPCRDGKARRTQPGIFPLADGVSGRVGLLRGAGNAIVPEVAEAFIRAAVETGLLFSPTQA